MSFVDTTMVQELEDGRSDGTRLGRAAASKVSFYGATPVVQPSGAAQAALTTTPTTAEIRDAVNALRSALVALGLIKGAA